MRRELPLFMCFGALAGAGCLHLNPSPPPVSKARYAVGPLRSDWAPIPSVKADLAYGDGVGRALAVNAVCMEGEDAPLEVLTHHLLMGFTDRQVLSEERFTLDGREAMRTRCMARLDGVPTELALVVLKKDGCIYDFSYVAPPDRFAERLSDFDTLVGGFHTEGPG